MKTRKCAKRGKSRKRETKYGKKYGQTKKHGGGVREVVYLNKNNIQIRNILQKMIDDTSLHLSTNENGVLINTYHDEVENRIRPGINWTYEGLSKSRR
jgi:hypothetical protein